MTESGTTFYVNQAAPSGGDGTSWATAYTDLQDALINENLKAGDQIWVAKGSYKPTSEIADGATEEQILTARRQSFVLVEGVALYGGFSGDEETLTERDWRSNKTILSGDIGNADNNSGNSYSVVTAKGITSRYSENRKPLTSSTILDGFTISGGCANGGSISGSQQGGGLFCDGAGSYNQCNPTLRNLIFSGNYAGGNGGALYMNAAFNGICSPILINVAFFGNKSDGFGGAVSCASGNGTSSPSFTNVTFTGNQAKNFGGAIEINGTGGTSSPTFINSIFWNNKAGGGGASIYSRYATPTFSDCLIHGGLSDTANGIRDDNSTVNSSGTILTTDPNFVAPVDPRTAPSRIGNLRLRYGSPAIGKGNIYVLSGVTTDLACKPRIYDNTVNMGAYEGCIIFVNHAANGAADGSSWEKAFTDINRALTTATAGDEIWVAKGTYEPTSASGNAARRESFTLKDKVAIYGGFIGNESRRQERDWHHFKTILSGDIGVQDEMKDNSYHVVTGTELSEDTIMDGFTISGGHADGEDTFSLGGGIYLSGGSPTLQNLIICGNHARLDGGGLYNEKASPTLINVVLSGNRAHSGGAVYNNGEGGDSSPTLTNVTISGNRADGRGGGLFNNGKDGTSQPTLTNVILWGNSAAINRDKDYDSHEMYNHNATPDGATTPTISAAPTISYSLVQGGIGRIKDAISGKYNVTLADGEYPCFTQPVHPSQAPTTAGDLSLQAGSPAINKGDNKALPRGLMTDLSGRQRIVNDKVDIGAYEIYDIVYVNHTANGTTKDGSSWANAYDDLQDALHRAKAGNEIWVAQGTYKPTTQTGAEARKISFELVEGVELYGGFAGDETRRDQRDWDAHKTTLSGDIGTPDNSSDNSYNVITGKGLTRATVLDGFTITAGNANGSGADSTAGGSGDGGGLFCYGEHLGNECSPTLRNLHFHDNHAVYGGAIAIMGSNHGKCIPILENIVFSDNSAESNGGAMLNNGGSGGVCSPILNNIIFIGNQAGTDDTRDIRTYRMGGAIHSYGKDGNCAPSLNNVILWGNSAVTGDQVSNNGASLIISDSIIEGGIDGSGILNKDGGKVVDGAGNDDGTQTSNIIYVNSKDNGVFEDKDGSSWAKAYSDLQKAIQNSAPGSEIWVAKGTYKPTTEIADEATEEQILSARNKSFALVEGVKIYGGFFGTETDRDQRDWKANKTILSGDLGAAGKCYHVVTASRLSDASVLDGFTITDGDASGSENSKERGGGLHLDGSGNGNQCKPKIQNVIFAANSGVLGGGLFADGSNGGECSPTLLNVTFSGNFAQNHGGGLFCDGDKGKSNPSIINGIFSGNKANKTGGAIHNNGGEGGKCSPRLSTIVLWNNSAQEGGNEIYNWFASPTISGSLIQGGLTGSGIGNENDDSYVVDGGHNRDENPDFIKPTELAVAPTKEGDIRPQNVVRKLATPFFSIPHANEEKYDFGTGEFTVMALVSPDTTVNSPAQTTSDVKNTGEIQPGNIISKFDPCKTDDGGWSLSITADRPKWLQSIIDASISALEEEKSAKEAEKTRLEGDAQHSVADVNQLKAIIFDIGVEIVEKKTDKYLFFTLFNQDGSCKEMCAPLNNKYYIKRKHGTEIENDADESTRAGTLFKRFTHMVAIVRDSSGECHLYLNGNKLDLLKNTTSTDLVNVSNDQPLNIGSVLPTSSEIKQAGVVRKVALWKTTLTQADIVEQMNSMSEPKPGTNCVGYWDVWHLTYEDESNPAGSTERKEGKDLSAVKNDMPIDQRMTLSELYMVLPFYMQEQEQNVWCWAATSVSVRNFYKPEQPISQCQLVEKSFREGSYLGHVPQNLIINLKDGTETCCDDAHPAKCNYGYVPAYALDIYGIKGEYVNPFPRTVKPYRKEINKWQPISLGTQSHFVITSGIYIVDRKNVDRKNVDRKKWIVINDPYYGVSTVLFETFTNNNYKYVNGEIWRNGINCTKPKPPEATVPA